MDYNPLEWILMDCVSTKMIDYHENIREYNRAEFHCNKTTLKLFKNEFERGRELEKSPVGL